MLSVLTAITFFIMPAQTTLYAADLTPIVNLPAGYFVMQADDTAPDGYISVKYDDLSGYVKTSDVAAVDYTPVTKYETKVKFRCQNDGQPVNLRQKPSAAAEIISVLPADAGGRCYGTLGGDALIAGGDTVWYYVDAAGVRGYCYYAHVSVDPTPPNIIEKEPDPPPDVPNVPTDAEPEQPKTMSKTVAVIFIIALCIPVPFIIFYLFKKPKNDK